MVGYFSKKIVVLGCVFFREKGGLSGVYLESIWSCFFFWKLQIESKTESKTIGMGVKTWMGLSSFENHGVEAVKSGKKPRFGNNVPGSKIVRCLIFVSC